MKTQLSSVVLFCIIHRKRAKTNETEYLFMPKAEHQPSFPATKYRPGEDLYNGLSRIMTGDLGLEPDSFFPETELPMLRNQKQNQQYEGLTKDYYLYPVEVSLTSDAWQKILKNETVDWYTIDEIPGQSVSQNTHAVIRALSHISSEVLKNNTPSMDALANSWARKNNGGVRKLEKSAINTILQTGNRAFNLRVADPYLPYQRQGLGFTWSFFTPKDKQDIHVHGQPAVEIYGVMEGQFVMWHKPMYERGALVWKKEVLNAGDWMEVEALHCHFGYWTTKEGYGTVIKAAGTGELAGVGRIGVSGKTVCKECPVEKQCQKHPEILPVLQEYQKAFEERDWEIMKQ